MNQLTKTIQYSPKEIRLSGSVTVRKKGSVQHNLGLIRLCHTKRFTRNNKLRNILYSYITCLDYKLNKADQLIRDDNTLFLGSTINNYRSMPSEIIRLFCKGHHSFNRFIKFKTQLLTFDLPKSTRTGLVVKSVRERNLTEEEIKSTTKNYILINYVIVNESFINYLVWFRNKMFEKGLNDYWNNIKSTFFYEFQRADVGMFTQDKRFNAFISELRSWFENVNENSYHNMTEYTNARTKELLSLDLESWLKTIR